MWGIGYFSTLLEGVQIRETFVEGSIYQKSYKCAYRSLTQRFLFPGIYLMIEGNICAIIQQYLARRYGELELAEIKLEVDIPEEGIYCNIDEKMFNRFI